MGKHYIPIRDPVLLSLAATVLQKQVSVVHVTIRELDRL